MHYNAIKGFNTCIILSLFIIIAPSFLWSSYPLNDESFEDMFNALSKKQPATSKKSVASKKTSFIRTKKPVTAQDQEELSILKTFDELAIIAEGLVKFTGSKETDDIVKTKKQAQERKEKEAEQRQKKQASSSKTWRPSSGGSNYSNPYSGGNYGGSRYPSGGNSWSGSSNPWAGGNRNAWSPNSYGYNSSESPYGFDDEMTQPEKQKKANKNKSYPPKKDDKNKTDKTDAESKKDAESTYNKLIKDLKEADGIVKKALTDITGINNPKQAAQTLMAKETFSTLTKQLENITSSLKSIDEETLKKPKSAKEHKIIAEQKNLDDSLKKLFPHTLLAATLSDKYGDAPFDKTDQDGAKKVLRSSIMEKNIDKGAIEARAKLLLERWEIINRAAYTRNKTNFELLKANNWDEAVAAKKPGWNAAPTAYQDADTIKRYFEMQNNEALGSIAQLFPLPTNTISAKQKEISDISNEIPNKNLSS